MAFGMELLDFVGLFMGIEWDLMEEAYVLW